MAVAAVRSPRGRAPNAGPGPASGTEDDRAYVTGLVQQLTMTVLAAAATVSEVLLILAPDGPELGAGVRVFPLLGATIFLFGFVLAARVLALAFQRRRT